MARLGRCPDSLKWLLPCVLLVPSLAVARQDAPPSPNESAEAYAARTCAEASKLVYQPPMDLILLAAKRLREEGKEYHRDFGIVITVGEDGLVRDVQFANSSGYRLLDVATRNWAFGRMYAPQECGLVDRYSVRQPLSVEGGT